MEIVKSCKPGLVFPEIRLLNITQHTMKTKDQGVGRQRRAAALDSNEPPQKWHHMKLPRPASVRLLTTRSLPSPCIFQPCYCWHFSVRSSSLWGAVLPMKACLQHPWPPPTICRESAPLPAGITKCPLEDKTMLSWQPLTKN